MVASELAPEACYWTLSLPELDEPGLTIGREWSDLDGDIPF